MVERVRLAVQRRAAAVRVRLLERPSVVSRTREPSVAAELAVIFVCHGNICRSPMAQGVLEARVASHGISHRLRIDSAGTNAERSLAPDPRAQLCALRHFGSIGAQRARRFTTSDFDAFDLILVMDETNRRDVLALARDGSDRARVRLLLDYAERGEIPDPVYGNRYAFEQAYRSIERACAKLAEELAARLDRRAGTA